MITAFVVSLIVGLAVYAIVYRLHRAPSTGSHILTSVMLSIVIAVMGTITYQVYVHGAVWLTVILLVATLYFVDCLRLTLIELYWDLV